MDPERWRQIEEVYFGAVALAPDERTSFLKDTATDPDMRSEVESLLNCEAADKFLDQTAIEILAKMYGVGELSGGADEAKGLVGNVIDNRYIVREHIKTGGMGEVYRAEHRLHGMPVAIKRLASEFRNREEFRQRFIEEARRALLLEHENVTKVKDVVEESGEVFVVMEYVQGQMLRARLDHPFAIDEFLDIATQCASALAAAHAERIIHLDIKPENIMVADSQKVKVCDFGIARQLPPAEVTHEIGEARESTPPWTLAGTPAYMAPEVLESNRFDTRADIFSLGVVFYEMLAGRHPFRGEDVRTTTRRIMTAAPISLGRLNPKPPSRLIRLVDKMLAKDPNQRPATANEVVQVLRRLRGDRSSFTDVWRYATRKPLAAAAALLTILIGAGSVALVLNFSPQPKLMAILPFAVVGGDQLNQVFCDGLVETLTTGLSQFEQFQNSFRVVPISEVRTEAVSSAREAQQVLGAELVVTGSCQRIADGFRITVNLVDTRSRAQVETRTINAALSDLALQDRVVQELATLLQVTLPQQASKVLALGNTSVPAAYDFYVQGRGYLQRYENIQSVDSAIALFQSAIANDSNYALAHASLGEAFWRKYELTKDSEFAELGSRSCEKALQISDRLAPVYVTLALIANSTGRYEDAIRHAKRSLELNLLDAGAYRELAKAYEAQGKLEEAESTYQQAIATHSIEWGSYNALGVFYRQHGRYPEAAAQFRKVIELTPDNVRGYNNLGAMYQQMQQYSDAEDTLKKSLAIRPTAAALSNLGTIYYYHMRRPDQAARMFEQAVKLNDLDYRFWRNLAIAYYWSPGEREKARPAYLKAIELAEQQRRINPRNQTLLIRLADCYAMVEENGRALDDLTQAMNAAPISDVNLMADVAGIYEKVGQRALAIEWIGRALRGGYPRDLVDNSPSLASLRSDPAFETRSKP
jgi:tetratricopeptide (TPR) repeat protein/tRNA A-37 threonylcarbamoyl transferase component Bud32